MCSGLTFRFSTGLLTQDLENPGGSQVVRGKLVLSITREPRKLLPQMDDCAESIPSYAEAPSTVSKRKKSPAPERDDQGYCLPFGWESRVTLQGRYYYVDHNTRNATWVPPFRVTPGTGDGHDGSPSPSDIQQSDSTDEHLDRPTGERKKIWIAIMGATGAGKSTFISHLVDDPVRVGSGLNGCKYRDICAIACHDEDKLTVYVRHRQSILLHVSAKRHTRLPYRHPWV